MISVGRPIHNCILSGNTVLFLENNLHIACVDLKGNVEQLSVSCFFLLAVDDEFCVGYHLDSMFLFHVASRTKYWTQPCELSISQFQRVSSLLFANMIDEDWKL